MFDPVTNSVIKTAFLIQLWRWCIFLLNRHSSVVFKQKPNKQHSPSLSFLLNQVCTISLTPYWAGLIICFSICREPVPKVTSKSLAWVKASSFGATKIAEICLCNSLKPLAILAWRLQLSICLYYSVTIEFKCL